VRFPASPQAQPAEAKRPDVTAAQVVAEDRGFEPRRVVTPNRISSVAAPMPGKFNHARDGTETQARRAGNSRIVRNHTGNTRRVRARNVRAADRIPVHLAAPSSASLRTSPTVLSLISAARAFATSGYCKRRASAITGLQAARVCDHGNRNGTGRSGGSEAGRGAGIMTHATSSAPEASGRDSGKICPSKSIL
jgi:hypothetical protein